MDVGERKLADRRARFHHHATDFAKKLARATTEERLSAVDHLHRLLDVLDLAEKPLKPEEQIDFDEELLKPLKDRSGSWNYPDDPVLLAEQAASLLREAAELSAEAEKILRVVARVASYGSSHRRQP